ncbi:migration and invasion inhibitory protein [Acanthopagrus schlegelii]
MWPTERLDVLRERNRDLLNRLEQQREELERPSCLGHSRKREREDEAEERRDSAEILTVTDGESGFARAALARPTMRFADTCEEQTGIQHTVPTPSLTSENAEGSEHTVPSELFIDSDGHLRDHPRLPEMRQAGTKSCLVNRSKEQRAVESRVTFQSDDCDKISTSDRHHLQPLLGYDWIAGVLDAEDSLIERSDEFFDHLRMFRSLNKDDCVHSPQAELSEANLSGLPLLTDEDSPEANMDTHQCTFSYRINSRLFPVPFHSQERCPVCKKHKSSHPHTAAEPALIRVSIPRSALLPPYKYRAHRRCSFDASDSLGLPSHCLSGWSNKSQYTLPPPSSLDLRSSLNLNNSTMSQNKELEDLSERKVANHQISDVSRLARHNLQHFSPKTKPGSSSYLLR